VTLECSRTLPKMGITTKHGCTPEILKAAEHFELSCKRWQAETLNAVVGKDRYQIIAAYMERLYGNIVGRAL
jgi:hypothetical protein